MNYIKSVFLSPEKFFRKEIRVRYTLLLGSLSFLIGSFYSYLIGSAETKLILSFFIGLPTLILISFILAHVLLKAFGSKASFLTALNKFYFLSFMYFLWLYLVVSLAYFFEIFKWFYLILLVSILIHSVYSLKGVYKVSGYKILGAYIVLSLYVIFIGLLFILSSLARGGG